MLRAIILSVCLFISVPAAFAEQILTENFDDQDYTDNGFYDNAGDGGEIVYLPGVARSGNYAIKFDGSQITEGLFRSMTISNGGEFYLKYYIYFPSPGWQWDYLSDTGLKHIRFYVNDAGTTDFTWMMYDLNQYYEICDPGEIIFEPGQWLWSPRRMAAGVALPQNEWLEVIIYLDWNSNSTSTISISMGDASIESTVNPSLGGSYDIFRVLFFANNGFGSSGYYYVDDVELWDEIPTGETPQPTTQATGNFSMSGN